MARGPHGVVHLPLLLQNDLVASQSSRDLQLGLRGSRIPGRMAKERGLPLGNAISSLTQEDCKADQAYIVSHSPLSSVFYFLSQSCGKERGETDSFTDGNSTKRGNGKFLRPTVGTLGSGCAPPRHLPRNTPADNGNATSSSCP